MNSKAGTDSPQQGLRRNSVGVAGMVLLVIAVTAPLTAVASNLSVSLAIGNGLGTMWMIVLTAVIFAFFSAGYVAISRQTVNSGAYYAYIGYGLGRRAGAAAAMMAIVGYNLAVATFVVLTGFYGSAGLEDHLGISVPWWVIALGVTVAVWVIGLLGVSIATRVAAWVAVTEFVLLGALVVAVIIGRPEGFRLDFLAPQNFLSGNPALAFVLVVTCFAGYEAAAIYGEEARGGPNSIGKATYAALGLLAVTFAAMTWILIAAVADVVSTAQDDPGALLTTVAQEYLGDWASAVLVFMIVFSFFAAAMSFHAMAARYMFSAGREGYLPRALARVGPKRRTPYVAGTAQAVIALAIVVPFVVVDADPLVEFLPASAGHNALVVLLLLTACSISVIVASVRGTLRASTWAGRIAPTIAAVAFIVAMYLVVTNYSTITGSSSAFINFMPLAIVIAIGYGWHKGGHGRGLSFDEDPAQHIADPSRLEHQ